MTASTALPTVGRIAPDFTVMTDAGATVSLSDFRGKTVVLYFYPKDNTTGCSQEACEFRDLMPKFKGLKATVLGISPDSAKKHQNFKKKFDLPFTLLVDADAVVAKRYGLWVQKMLYGHKYMAVERTTYIIDGDGVICMVFSKVNIDGHAADVAQALKDLRLA